jgi:diguanylate cyclase (GGDEF)-like protein/PAS domain S-box-containing protein
VEPDAAIRQFLYDPAMQSEILTYGGEFTTPAREAEYRAERMPECLRHARLVFLYAFVINLLFYLNDWHFYGDPQFYIAIPARTVIVMASLICLLLVGKITGFNRLQRLCVAWSCPVIVACAALLTPHTESALFVAFALPNIFYLALPISFRWNLGLGIGCSIGVMAAYILPGPLSEASFGLVLGMVMVNVVLALVLIRSNRLRRLEWAATRSERAANRELSEHREMLRTILAAIPTPLIITAKDSSRLIQVNDAARRYFAETMTRDTLMIGDYLDRRELARLAAALQLYGYVTGFETRLHLSDGSVHDVLLAANTVKINDAEAILTVLTDITQRKEMEAHLERLATTDPLTGLANRGRFFAIATAEIKRAERYERPLAVIMVDIDFFKRINDAYGHEVGDLALREFANLCRTIARRQDIVARLGGEEFGLLLPETDRAEALALADRLRLAVEALRSDGLPAPMTISVGVSEVFLGEVTVDAALARADQALYIAKRSGRNRTVHYDYAELVAP